MMCEKCGRSCTEEGCTNCGAGFVPECNPTTCPIPQKAKHTCYREQLPLSKQANAMHLRDVAMNALGAWVGEDLQAFYTVTGSATQTSAP